MTEPVKVSSESDPRPLADRLIQGAAWMVAMRWSVRLIGLVNTLVLVRLLTPEDFGVVAMAMIVVAFVNAFNDMGLDLALIRLPDLTAGHYHSAWTITMLLGAFNSLALALVAPVVANFYADPRLLPVMLALAILPLIEGMSNIRTLDFRRNLEFGKDFLCTVIGRAIALPITIGLAIVLQNYWALVVGMITQSLLAVVVGYLMRPFVPRLSGVYFRELIGFSVWVQIRNVGQTLGQRIDQLYVGKRLGAGELGGYQISQEITEMIANEMVLPLGRALLPGYARLVAEPERLWAAFFKVLGLYAILALGVAGGLYAIAVDLVPLLLGTQWVGFVSVFQLLSLAGGLAAIGFATNPLLVAMGQVRLVAVAVWIRLGLSILALSAVAWWAGGLEAIAWARLVVSSVLMILVVGIAIRVVRGSFRGAAALLLRPALAMSTMLMAILSFQRAVDLPAWSRLLLEIPLGVLVYGISLLGLWWIAGRPDGIERELLTRALVWIRRGWRRLRPRRPDSAPEI